MHQATIRRVSQWATDIFEIFNQDLATDMPVIERASNELDDYVRSFVDQRHAEPQ